MTKFFQLSLFATLAVIGLSYGKLEPRISPPEISPSDLPAETQEMEIKEPKYKYSIRRVTPDPNFEYKALKAEPNQNIEFKVRFIAPKTNSESNQLIEIRKKLAEFREKRKQEEESKK